MTDREKHIELDLPFIQAVWPIIQSAATRYSLDPYIIAAIISRESGGGRILGLWGNPLGTGDRGHGRGLMQIDDRWHKVFTSGDDWRDPSKNINYGVGLLADYYKTALKKGLGPEVALRVAVAGYNQGIGGALEDWRKYGDPDRTTTGRNYSADVYARAGLLRERLKKKLDPEPERSCSGSCSGLSETEGG